MPNVFLSPSAQTGNYYVTGGTEEQSMNRLCDRVEPWLRSSGIAYVRAPRGQPPSQSILQANAGRFDLYTALHSNAAPEGQYGSYRGVDVYYYQRGQNSRRAALGFAEALRTVYPLPQRVRTVPTLDLGEVTRTRAPAVLLELGYHDNIQDALWLRDDLDAIAQAVAASDGGIQTMLDDAAMAVMALNGGSAVPLWNSWLDGMAEGAPEADALDIDAIKAVFAAGFEELDDMSGAKVGDKTMMDAVIPASEAIAAYAGDDEDELFRLAAEAAVQGAENSRNFVSKFGRAKSYGAKTIGTPDAGAVSMAKFFAGLAK